MATAQAPFKNAAAAIYTVCVSKDYPTLPDDISDEAVSFLARCVFSSVGSVTIIIYTTPLLSKVTVVI